MRNGTIFCEYTEPFITAAKRGDCTQKFPDLGKFMIPTQTKETFVPCSEVVTWYPLEYQTLYGQDSRITQALRGIFSVTFNVTGAITEMTLKSPMSL